MSISRNVVQSCLWEVQARKPGNVHPCACFRDLTFEDFTRSAHALASAFDPPGMNIGELVLRAARATRNAVGKNTNLGILLLLAPLAISPTPKELQRLLDSTTIRDAELVYEAIRIMHPGGLGAVEDQDISRPPTCTLAEAMAMAQDRDRIAWQYANRFGDVFGRGQLWLMDGFERHGCVEAAIIYCHLKFLAAMPDTLIARKCGLTIARDVMDRTCEFWDRGGLDTHEGRAAGKALDQHLRSDGNRLNPGTTADLVCASLFVALHENKISDSAPFAWAVEDWL